MEEKSDHIPMEMKAHFSPWTEMFSGMAEDQAANSPTQPQQAETAQSQRAERASDSDSAEPTRNALSSIFNRS